MRRFAKGLTIWAVLTACAGGVASFVVGSDTTPSASLTVAAEEPERDAAPRDEPASTVPAPSTTVTTLPAPTAPAAPEPTVPATEPEPEPTTTTAPPAPEAPSFTMSTNTISASDFDGYVYTAGTGCTGPDHVDDEYGIVGLLLDPDGTLRNAGDRVPTEPGTGDWLSTMWVGNVGEYLYGYACTALDGTVLFEYARQPLTVLP